MEEVRDFRDQMFYREMLHLREDQRLRKPDRQTSSRSRSIGVSYSTACKGQPTSRQSPRSSTPIFNADRCER
jgi:hypothetical protein